jgi:uncharacterized protein (TIGR03067 family)
MRTYALLLSAAVASLAFAPAPLRKPDSAKDDLKQMQGKWEVVSCAFEGRPVGGAARWVVIAGGRMTFYNADGSVASQWAFTLDAKARPRATDAKREDVPDYPICRGRYELKGDRLTKVYTYGADERPAGLDGSKPKHWVDVLKRPRP